MKLKMSEKSLFATLLRAPWWVSFVVMLAVALAAGALLPDAYKTAGMLGGFPFLVIGVMAAWRQRNALSNDRIDALTGQARAMAWREFAAVVETALRKQGFEVRPLNNGPADFKIEKNGRITLVSAKRWKAASVGAEPLRELLAAVESQEAFSCSCMSLGSFSPAAVALAQQHPLQLLGPTEIAQLVHDAGQANKA
ncbi:restriction endonuclease [Limnohabitans sp. MMS-10A-160]|uniref:restriction endonuclease n=1 Tax=unclassified Limnohabitans TaxID=2626134 RepID=UPI000D379447|nr:MULTISPECIES: restriction endonuclease [unclassified Limnohabitans]PUE19188.1 restriction endonuclease [Limnohabitans sp. MMS-10A-192]PUE26067.1 restriction endonuclease [Limnohabitans sp. MMS-10A-160]